MSMELSCDCKVPVSSVWMVDVRISCPSSAIRLNVCQIIKSSEMKRNDALGMRFISFK